jgi:fimbrial chaperone protein
MFVSNRNFRVAILWLAGTASALAGSFGVSPLRAELKGAHRMEVLTITNSADTPLEVQVQAVAWSTHDGEDQLEPTREILVTPPIFKVAAHGQQVVRVALRREPAPDRELDYRVLLTEIPPPATDEFSGAQVALRLSLPVFVAAAGPAQEHLQWRTRWTGDAEVELTAENTGNAHLKVIDFDAGFAAGAATAHVPVTRYVLPGATATWTFKAPEGVRRNSAVHLTGTSDRGAFTADPVDAGT